MFVERIEELIQAERPDTINKRTSANQLSDIKKPVESIVDDYLKEKIIMAANKGQSTS